MKIFIHRDFAICSHDGALIETIAAIACMPPGGTVLLAAEKSCQFSFEDGIDAFFHLSAKKFIDGNTTLKSRCEKTCGKIRHKETFFLCVLFGHLTR